MKSPTGSVLFFGDLPPGAFFLFDQKDIGRSVGIKVIHDGKPCWLPLNEIASPKPVWGTKLIDGVFVISYPRLYPINIKSFQTTGHPAGSLVVAGDRQFLAFSFNPAIRSFIDLDTGNVESESEMPGPFGWFPRWSLNYKGSGELKRIATFDAANASAECEA